MKGAVGGHGQGILPIDAGLRTGSPAFPDTNRKPRSINNFVSQTKIIPAGHLFPRRGGTDKPESFLALVNRVFFPRCPLRTVPVACLVTGQGRTAMPAKPFLAVCGVIGAAAGL